jgi:hypothetical protein
LRDDRQKLIASSAPEPVVDVPEPIDVDEQGARQHPRLASRSRDDSLGTVQRECLVGKPR